MTMDFTRPVVSSDDALISAQDSSDHIVSHVDPPAIATTTSEQDRTTAGQRAVNLIWESTQRQIALGVIGCALLTGVGLAFLGRYLGTHDIQLAAVVFLFGVANLVTGFYFGRTNHTRSGGVGGQDAGPR